MTWRTGIWLALGLARGLYTTDPNPRVGCVFVRDGPGGRRGLA
jgi:pyrimidine deaminase RibD-like protein